MSKQTIAGMVVVLLFLAALSQAVPAQQGPGGGPGPGMMRGEGMGRELTPEQFRETKARVLKFIDERRTRLDQEKACVEKATNDAELKKCRPERPTRPGGGMQGEPGQQRPPRPGGGEQRQ